MESPYLYLILDISAIAVPLAFSFYPKAPFVKKWKYLWPSIFITAIFFMVWDEVFTRIGVWGFNEKYLCGYYLGSLPIEEVLFFICIPYACIFTYEALGYLFPNDILQKSHRTISIIIASVLALIGIFSYPKLYTSITFALLAIWLIGLLIKKATWLGRFYFAYIFILIPFFIINGILTGSGLSEPVVWYNNSENLGLRMGTIPVEDTFYGMLLILMNITLFEFFQMRDNKLRPR